MRIALLVLLLVPGEGERIVFLGDSITDGHTLPLLVRQASGATCINAGVAGDTAAGMRRRLERDVLPRRPNRVALSVGINDVLRNVTAADYEADVTAISERLKRDRIPLIVLTPTVLGPKHADAEKRLADYVGVLRRRRGTPSPRCTTGCAKRGPRGATCWSPTRSTSRSRATA